MNPDGGMATLLKIIPWRRNELAKEPAQNAELTIPKISIVAPIIKIYNIYVQIDHAAQVVKCFKSYGY
jgi:hypothetical protein